MYVKHMIVALMAVLFFVNHSYTIDNTPICTIHTPNSILNEKENYEIRFVGNRTRYATCTSAAWFHDNCLAILNLYGKKLITYVFDKETKTCTEFQEINMQHKAPSLRPEHITVSPNGTLLAVCHSRANKGCIIVYAIDTNTHLINPVPIFSLPIKGFVHNVRFTHDGKYLAFASFDKQNATCVYKIVNNPDNFNLTHIFTMANQLPLAKQKGINFTQDDEYAVLIHALSITDSVHNPFKSVITVHKFNKLDGTLGPAICSVKESDCPEDITFLHNDTAIVVSDHTHDTIHAYPFDPKTGQIGDGYILLQNPQAQLNFPHGVNVSQDGNYLAVANLGNDTCTVYQVAS